MLKRLSRHTVHKRHKHSKLIPEVVMSMQSLSNVTSNHDFHKFNAHQNGMMPTMHFHLAASVNPATDIPLMPVVGCRGSNNFQLHWLNNNELQFTIELEKILQEMHKHGMPDEHEHFNFVLHGNANADADSDKVQEDRDGSVFLRKNGRSLSKKRPATTANIIDYHSDSASSIMSDYSDGVPAQVLEGNLLDAIDRKIEALLKDWSHNADMLFSIDPVDGSFLLWNLDWLDEYSLYDFRQAQINFAFRLPHAFPVPDACSINSMPLIYCNYNKMDVKSAMKMNETGIQKDFHAKQSSAVSGKNSPGQNNNMLIPNVLLISKHSNGSLNQWQITFQEDSKFMTVVSVAHVSRACGHRFRTNSAICHPALPLLITTSQHLKGSDSSKNSENDEKKTGFIYCSELILWRVDPVGPLSKSGGIVELAKINSKQLSAFCNVAWVPTLLPSTILGSYSNSPSTLFVASDGECLRLYQAVIDARSLLYEVNSRTESSFCSTSSSGYNNSVQEQPSELFNIISVQSSARPGCIIELDAFTDALKMWQQTQLLHVFQEPMVTGKNSFKRDNNIDPIVDLRNIGSFEENFFVVVLEKNEDKGSTLHMWKITLSSSQSGHQSAEAIAEKSYMMDFMVASEDIDDSYPPSHCESPTNATAKTNMVKLVVATTKVSCQRLVLPEGVSVRCANVAAGHLSSASIYPACLAPYLLVTVCSDGVARFWNCNVSSDICELANMTYSGNIQTLCMKNFEFGVEEEDGVRRQRRRSIIQKVTQETRYSWVPWKPMYQADKSSDIHIAGKPITVSCAYTGRIAIAYRSQGQKTQGTAPDNRFFNLFVVIYECESTGGSEWVKEDTIELQNICIPDCHVDVDLDLSPDTSANHSDTESSSQSLTPASTFINLCHTKSVPSFSALVCAKKEQKDREDKVSMIHQKHLVQLDWVSTEDGSHILTVGVGSKVMMYAQVSDDFMEESKKENMEENAQSGIISMNEPGMKTPFGDQALSRKMSSMVHKSKSMVVDDYEEMLQWMKLRTIDLMTADGLPPLPMHISWVRGGILVVGMDNEMHVYSQWHWLQNPAESSTDSAKSDVRNMEDKSFSMAAGHRESLFTIKKHLPSTKTSVSVPNFKRISTSLLKKEAVKCPADMKKTKTKLNLERSESTTNLMVVHEFGLFEAAHQASLVLPQYHPKSLVELLNFGKVKRVKAILAHLVRCIAGRNLSQAMNGEDIDHRIFQAQSKSVCQNPSSMPTPILSEEPSQDYVEITSVPLLPLYALLAADSDQSQIQTNLITQAGQSLIDKTDYKELFQTSKFGEDELDINILSSSIEDKPHILRTQSVVSSNGASLNPYHFSTRQAQILGQYLTRMHLPGLSGQDQMYLLALADTVAQTKTDIAQSFEIPGTNQGHSPTNHRTETLDDCGLRFLLAVRQYQYLVRFLPPVQRAQLVHHGLKSYNLVWAFHSEAMEELLNLIPSSTGTHLTWKDLRTYGAGWWIHNINVLRRTIENIAKDAFQASKDPMDSALFYLAMKRKNVLWGLFRSVENKKMADFLKNDFSDERWRKAALKNAFDLLGKQRFELAAGFFFLAGSLNDAIEVILNKLHDVQLALVVCRLYDGEDMLCPAVKKILLNHILGCDADGRKSDSFILHPDPFLRSMTYWMLKDYRNALQTLLDCDLGKLDRKNSELFTISNVFNFYNFLRTHPLVLRQKIVSAAPIRKSKHMLSGFTRRQTIVGTMADQDEITTFIDKVTPIERQLFFSTAHAHYKNGNPVLALEVLCKLPAVIYFDDLDAGMELLMSRTGSDTRMISQCSIGADRENGQPGMSLDHHSPNNAARAGDSTAKSLDQSHRDASAADYSVDWSKPVSSVVEQKADLIDWSQTLPAKAKANSIDWNSPVRLQDSIELKLDVTLLSGEEDDDSSTASNSKQKNKINGELDNVLIPKISVEDIEMDNEDIVASSLKHIRSKRHKFQEVDIYAQQYKFIACLKVMMEEMRTLATGFEVDGGQLRFQVFIWLEREVEALQQLCNYGENDDFAGDGRRVANEGFEGDELRPDSPIPLQRKGSTRSNSSLNKPTLHEVMLAEKMDLDAKMERMGRRKQWLRQNQQLLSTLVAYCVLQGAAGGGIASVQMELLLLLQELQQEKPHQQLLSPLPFPTMLPLLSAAIASSKSVTADPIQHIQCLSQDLLHSVIEFTLPPDLGGPLPTVLVMRNLSVVLASCVYQCLCDSDSFVVALNENADVGFEGFGNSANVVCDSSHLMAGVRKLRNKANTSVDDINTQPVKWPGVTSLRVLLMREKDENAPKLGILLTESLFAVFVSLLINALAMYDCFLLFRLTAHKFDHRLWSALFGGGVKSVIRLGNLASQRAKISDGAGGSQGKTDKLYNKRFKLNMKIISHQRRTVDGKKTFKEKFVPPEVSMITYFMTKPCVEDNDAMFNYDSDDVLSEDENRDTGEEAKEDLNRSTSLNLPNVHQHSVPGSYSWCLIRYCTVKLILQNLSAFLPKIGIELQELPVCSPLLHALLQTMKSWEEMLLGKVELLATPPENYIPGLAVDVIPGVPSTKYKALLNKSNSPFIDSPSTLPIKRLWFHLVKQESLRDIFIQYIFRKNKLTDQADKEDTTLACSNLSVPPEPFKIIHKEQDIITAFAIGQNDFNPESNASCLILSTQKELIELDIYSVLNLPQWLDDENKMIIKSFNCPTPANPMNNVDCFVVQTPSKTLAHTAESGIATPANNQNSASSTAGGFLVPGQMALAPTGRVTNVVSRRPMGGIRRICSHPTLPHYLTGNTDGSVKLWEWGHLQSLATLRVPGTFPKVTKVLFNAQGNKCCVSDAEGSICLWQVGHRSNSNKAILSLPCHNKTINDFVFVGSSSIIATAGHSSDNRNVCIWDTLLPQWSACVQAYVCHEHGSQCLVYAPNHQLLITGGRKGEIAIFDIRQHLQRHTLQAHESAIRCIALDPEEDYFVTGSADGDIKVWDLKVHQLLASFIGEHTKSNTFFRNVGSMSGVTQLTVGPKNRLFSCGVDGSMKFRTLPDRDVIVKFLSSC